MRKHLSFLLAFVLGAVFLCILSILQKIGLVGALSWEVFIVPCLFGGSMGLLFEMRHYKVKELKNILQKTHDDLEVKVRERTAELEKDILKRKAAEEALRESEERLQAIFEATPNPVVVYDTEGLPLYMNPAFTETFGWTLDELRGRRIPFVPEDETDDTAQKIKEIYTTGKPGTLHTRRLTRRGEMIDVIVSAAIIKGPEGTPSGMVVNLTDISEQRQLEAQFQQAQRMEAVGTLAGGIAHDFNNLLMSIQGNVSLMAMDKESSDPDLEGLRKIEQCVQEGADLTRQLLGFARGGKYEIKPTDLNELLRRQNRIFGRTKKEIKIHGIYEKDLWSVKADKSQIQQVLMNLYVNASQAMPGGGDLYTRTENVILEENHVRPYEVSPGKYVKISVKDTGTGMDEKTKKRIFEPFFTTQSMGMGRGTGLGLASVYGIVKNHGGFIKVYSEKGKGSTFDIYLPASDFEAGEWGPEPREELEYGDETVLLVDDEERVLDVGQRLLERLGYRAFVAKSGEEAVEVYRKNQKDIDLVVLDMIMPGMNGGETYDRLKEIDPDVKSLLSSGYSLDGQAKEILDRGCNGFIQKPFDMKDISRKIRETLGGPCHGR